MQDKAGMEQYGPSGFYTIMCLYIKIIIRTGIVIKLLDKGAIKLS